MDINTKKDTPSNLWNASRDMEIAAMRKLTKDLSVLESAARHCYESGVQVATLKGKHQHEYDDMKLAAVFLKRALTDLRAVWLLISMGYTSQAASVAASLFEHALAVNCLAGSPENAKTVHNENDDLPWKPKELAKSLAKQHQNEAKQKGETFGQSEYELTWREIYYGYKLLCKIKHPTGRSTIYDTTNTVRPNGTYVIMAYPNIKPEDLPLKVVIMSIAVNRCYDAIRKFAIELNCDKDEPYFHDFCDRLNTVNHFADTALKSVAELRLPFDISDTPFYKEYMQYKAREKRDRQ